MNPEIELTHVRLRRAEIRMEQFKAESRLFFESNPYKVVVKTYPKGNGFKEIRRTFHVLSEPPPDLGVTFGETVHQLRAACDNMIHGIARSWGLRVKGPLYFPMFDRMTPQPGGGRDYLSWANSTGKGFPDAVKEILKTLQPGYVDATSGPSCKPEDHPLHILNGLWNQDKHVTPLHVGGVHLNVRIPGIWSEAKSTRLNDVVLIDGTHVREGLIHAGNMFEDGDVIARLTVPVLTPIDQVQIPVTAYVTIDKRSPVAAGRKSEPLLTELYEFVRDRVVQPLTPFLR